MRLLTNFKWALLALVSVLLIAVVSATTDIAAGASVMLNGPLNLQVDLGLDKIPGIDLPTAQLMYRWISISLIMWIALVSDKKTQHIMMVFVAIEAAMLAWFGWFTITNADGTINPAGPWGLVILCAVMVVVSYMTETNKITFGTGGKGDPILNIFMFLLLFQGAIGLLNGAAIFPVDAQMATPEICSGTNFGHCQMDGAAQLQNMKTNTITGNQDKGLLSQFFDYATSAVSMGWGAVLLIIQIAVSLAFIGGTITMAYPWILQSGPALALVGALQAGVWVIYALMLARLMGKTTIGEMRL